MFKMIFGAIWLVFMAFFTFLFYADVGGTIRVNGEIVSQAEFNSMLFPKILIGLFWLIGIFLIISGIKKIIKDKMTDKNGEETFAKVINIYPSGGNINGAPELKGDFCVYIPLENKIEIISEIIGFKEPSYEIGSYVKVKYFNNDINIEDEIIPDSVPFGIKQKIDENKLSNEIIMENNNDDSYVMINGVKYKKVDE